MENPQLFESTKSLIEKTLAPHKLRWEDVDSVMPVYDFGQVLAQTGIFNSWNFKMAILIEKASLSVSAWSSTVGSST